MSSATCGTIDLTGLACCLPATRVEASKLRAGTLLKAQASIGCNQARLPAADPAAHGARNVDGHRDIAGLRCRVDVVGVKWAKEDVAGLVGHDRLRRKL